MLLTSFSSKAMIKENIKRYWVIPLLSLLGYMLLGMLPVILNYHSFNNVSSYAAGFISGGGFVPNFLMTATAVSASSAVFGYLHDPVSTTAVHAMPAGRKRLFASAAFSGWSLVMIPIVVIAFLMLVLRGASVSKDFDPEGLLYEGTFRIYQGTAGEIFTLPHSLLFILSMTVTATAVFAICTLSAVLSGKGTIHALLCIFLLVLPNYLAFQINSILTTYLYGFYGMDINYSLLSALSYALTKDTYELDPKYALYHLVLGAVLFVASYFIYSKVKLERIGSATTFPAVGDILCGLLTFMLSIGFAEIIVLFAEDGAGKSSRFIIVALISSLVFYMLMRMIADSTMSVFNLKNLKKYAVCLAILTIFLLLSAGDVTRYQKKMVKVSNVESVEFYTNLADNIGIGQGFDNQAVYTDKGMINAVMNLQEQAIKTRNIVSSDDAEDMTYTAYITWNLKDGRTSRRQYDIKCGKDFKGNEEAFKKIYEQQSFRDALQNRIVSLSDKVQTIQIYGDKEYEDGELVEVRVLSKDVDGLLDAIGKDVKEKSFDEANDGNYLGEWIVCVDGMGPDLNVISENSIQFSYYVYKNDRNTSEYLREKGYLEQVVTAEGLKN